MNRHLWRACARSGRSGVTLIELLVTIVIAGIAFAALVPVFVGASQSSAGDNARTVGLSLAQDKLERIRSLAYGDVTLDNLNESAFAAAHGLGNEASVSNGNSEKVYSIAYDVTYVYDPASTAPHDPGYEMYKQVTVDAYWTGNPRPVKHTVLRTDIYMQYAGPVIYSVDVTPRDKVISSPTNGMIVPGLDGVVTISAYVQTGIAVREVRFALSSGGGSYKKTFTQAVGTGGVYVWSWLITGAPDGFYSITATAVSEGGYLGNTWQVAEQLEAGASRAPVDLVATPGDGSVVLDWQAPATGDIAYYEVWRSTTALSTDATMIATNLTSIHYPDTGLTNATRYYYWVYAFDLIDNESDPATGDATPDLTPGDTTGPSVPVLTSTVQASSILLSWSTSVDQPPPASPAGLEYYEIFRSTDGTNYTILTTMGPLSVSYADPVGSGSIDYWYKIRAVDASENINRSLFSNVQGPLKTVLAVEILTVANDRKAQGAPCTVTVQDIASKQYYDQDGLSSSTVPATVVSIASKGGSAQWVKLPADRVYTVTATYAQGKPLSISQTAPPWTLSFK